MFDIEQIVSGRDFAAWHTRRGQPEGEMTKQKAQRGAMAEKVLAAFKPGEWLAPRDIAKAAGIDSATYVLGRLVAEGKLAKRGSTSDRRYALTGTAGADADTQAPARGTQRPKRGTQRAKRETKPGRKKRAQGNGAAAKSIVTASDAQLPDFIAALTDQKALVVIGANHTHLFSQDETLSIADLILANFEVNA